MCGSAGAGDDPGETVTIEVVGGDRGAAQIFWMRATGVVPASARLFSGLFD